MVQDKEDQLVDAVGGSGEGQKLEGWKVGEDRDEDLPIGFLLVDWILEIGTGKAYLVRKILNRSGSCNHHLVDFLQIKE